MPLTVSTPRNNENHVVEIYRKLAMTNYFQNKFGSRQPTLYGSYSYRSIINKKNKNFIKKCNMV